MRILITGSEGFVGTALKKELVARGHEVFGCDLTHSEDPHVYRADVTELRQLHAVFTIARPHLVYHLAAEFGRMNGEAFFEQMWATNTIGTRNVIEECLGCDAIMAFSSSSEAYGNICAKEPIKEEILETVAPDFHNEYALSKWTNERQIRIAIANRGLRAVIFRFFNAYGPGEFYSPYRSVVCLFVYRMLKGIPVKVHQGSYRSHLWIGDLVNTIANLTNDRVKSEAHKWSGPGMVPIFNVGSQQMESIEDLYERLRALLPDTRSLAEFAAPEKANVQAKQPDITRAKTHLYHNSSVTLSEGLRWTIDWMKEIYR